MRIMPALFALLLAACGLKGPLYLPDAERQRAAPASEDDEAAAKKRTAPRPAPQSQKEDATPGETPVTSPPDPDRPANPEPASPPPGR